MLFKVDTDIRILATFLGVDYPMSSQQPNPVTPYIRFADWCLNFDSLSEEAKHTVEVLSKTARTSNCYEAEQILSNLTSLNLYGDQISDLTPLQSLTNLTELRLENNQISDLTPLQSLTNLIRLDLYNNHRSDITPLQSLSDLTPLSLRNNQISDLTTLQYLTNLTKLNLYNNQISDITPLQSLTNLTKLNLHNNQISDITPLQSLTNLTELHLYGNQISDLTPLSSLTNLTELNLTGLNLHNNQISNLTPLSSLTNLTGLNLHNNQISDITPLQSLTNLTSLRLQKNQISDLTPLQSLRNLTFLALEYNQISDLTPLQSLRNLTSLSLDYNQISDLTPLQSLRNLTSLSLDYNQISDLTPLQSLRNLTSLALGNNQISDLTPLQSLTNLTHLRLYNNQISDLIPLKSLTNLKSLCLDNQISDLIHLQSLWKSIANSTEQVDRTRAAAAIEFAYAAIGKTCKKIIFCSSPHSAITQLKNLKFPTNKTDFFQLIDRQLILACRPFDCIICNGLYSSSIRWERELEQELKRDFSDYWQYLNSIATGRYLLKTICMADFCASVIRITLNPDAQKALECLKQLLVECGWIFAFEDVCYACDRPLKISLDSEDRLHAEGESAIEFADGYKIYSYHGVTLPEKYGQLHPHQWEARWILEEENAELRRVLIQGIGYARICSELQAAELDSWQEYTLLKIDNADVEPIYLLKMTCPSTGFIHALRVPPDMQSAREAIRWVNWDVDYEEFSVQT
jgi:internalin A